MGSFFSGLLLGVLAGGVTGLMLTPQSGKELQASLRAGWERAVESGRQAAEARRRELEAEFLRAKNKPATGT